MLKLIKWSMVSAIVLGGTGLFVFGDHFGSYFTTVSNSVRESVRGNIPVEFEIKRAEKLIRAIDPEILDCKKEVARADVELGYLVRDVERLTETVATQEKKLKSGRGYLTDATVSSFALGSRSYSRQRIELDLARTFESFKNNKAILGAKRALIERQSMAVAASRTKLDVVRTRKAELENTIATLKVQKQHLDALAASSRRFDLDDSALSQATEVLADVKKRLDVAQRMIEDDIFFADGIRTDAGPTRNILEEIDQHFAEVPSAKKGLSPRATAPPAKLGG